MGPQEYARAQQQQEQLIPQKKQKKQKPPKQPKPPREGGSAWKVVLQFVVGLLVIAGVAAAIVALYIKYYQ
jgi:hypothetical protein